MLVEAVREGKIIKLLTLNGNPGLSWEVRVQVRKALTRNYKDKSEGMKLEEDKQQHGSKKGRDLWTQEDDLDENIITPLEDISNME